MNASFPTLIDAYNYVAKLSREMPFQASRVYSDLLKKPNDPFRRLIGVGRKAEGVCKRLAPGGQWRIEIEVPGTDYERAGVFGSVLVKTQHHRASAWYSRYLPYAYAMMKSEWDFKCSGVDFQSINSYFGTCMGYSHMILGTSDRFEAEDVDLYDKLSDRSSEFKPETLPFSAVYNYAICFIAVQDPYLLAKHTHKDSWQWEHACDVLESLDMATPNYRQSLMKS